MRKFDWTYHIAEQPKSGLSVSEYCQRNKIPDAQFYAQRKKCKASSNKEFTELSIKPFKKEKVLELKITLMEDEKIHFSGFSNDSSLFSAIFGRFNP